MFYEIGQKILSLFHKALQKRPWPSSIGVDCEVLECEMQRFSLWGANLGLFETGHRSLDYRLRDAGHVRSFTVDLLKDLKNSLVHASSIANGNRLPYDRMGEHDGQAHAEAWTDRLTDVPSDDGQTDGSNSSIPEEGPMISGTLDDDCRPELQIRIEDICDTIDRLYRLAIQIQHSVSRKPANVDLYKHIETHDKQFYIEQLRCRQKEGVRYALGWVESPDFAGHCDEFLVDRLQNANQARRQQFVYWQRYKNKATQAVAKATRASTVSKSAITLNPSLKAGAESRLGAPNEQSSNFTKSVLTSVQRVPQDFTFTDNVSVTSTVSHVPTLRGNGGEKLAWPPVPDHFPKNRELECPFCFFFCPSQYLQPKKWRAHLKQDLRPYVCTYEECSLNDHLFGSFEEWRAHEESAHRRAWRCPEHQTVEFREQVNFIEHIENTHRDEKDLLLTPELLAAREFTLKRPERPCPLCGKEIDDNATMQTHVAVHLETVALFTLPNIDEDQDESQEANSVSNMANQKFAESRTGDSDSSVDLIFSDFGDDKNSQLPSVTSRELSAEEVNHLKETSQENISDDVEKWIRNCACDEKYLGEDPEDVDLPKKYIRHVQSPAYCRQCKDGAQTFHDERALAGHIARFHTPFRKVWICIDVSVDKKMLESCQSCRSGVRYGAKHSAATHLLERHFGPKASLETLTGWIEEVEEPNPDPLDSEADLAGSTANEALDEDNAEPIPSADPDHHRHDSSTKNTAKEESTDSGEEIIRKAMYELRIKVSADDARIIQFTSLHDVWLLARDIQREQIERARLQNMRRIEPILRSLESYAGVIDTFCQGFSPMAWIWGPIKLILTIARQYSSILEKILDAYRSIAEHIPRIDKLQAAFKEDEDFRKVLGLIYKDIAEFHQRTYRFLRRRGWAVLFAFDWGLFERRFKSLLESMAFRVELVDREAAALHSIDMKARDLDRLEYEKEEKQRQLMMFQAVHSWLSAAEDGQEEFLEDLANKRHQGTCNWVLEQEVIKAWVEPTEIEPLVWLTGKPGGGKSVLASFIIHHLQTRKDSTVVYFFCALNSNRTTCAEVLRTMAFQALQQNPDLASLVYQGYVQTISTRSTPKMKAMLKEIFAVAKCVHLVVDGVDEYEPKTQQEILRVLSDIQRSSKDIVKILISSRVERYISELLPIKAHFSLNGRTDGVIELFAASKLKEIEDWFPTINEALVGRIKTRMLDLAHGMIYWVVLVTAHLRDQVSQSDLVDAINELPAGLDNVYGRCLDRLMGLPQSAKNRAFLVLFWLCAAFRPVTVHEMADAVSLQSRNTAMLNEKTLILNLQSNIIDLCAPLVEEGPEECLHFVHFSVKEFLLDPRSGPFIKLATAHLCIARSCLSSLVSSFVVIPHLAESSQEPEPSDVVPDNFTLFDYAQNFWADHVQAYLSHSDTSLDSNNEDDAGLLSLLTSLSRVRKDPRSVDVHGFPNSFSNAPPGLRKLSGNPLLLALVVDWLDFKRRAMEARELGLLSENFAEWQVVEDPTYISLIASKLRSMRKGLLHNDMATLPTYSGDRTLASGELTLTKTSDDPEQDSHKIGPPLASKKKKITHEKDETEVTELDSDIHGY